MASHDPSGQQETVAVLDLLAGCHVIDPHDLRPARPISQMPFGEIQETGVGRLQTGLTLGSVVRRSCAREGWVNDADQPCVISARLALPEIAQRSGFRLARGTPPPCAGTAADGGFPDVEFAGDLSDLGGVHVELVTTRTGRRALRAILTAHHPGGIAPSRCGSLLLDPQCPSGPYRGLYSASIWVKIHLMP